MSIDHSPSVCICIATHRRPESLLRLLDSLAQLRAGPGFTPQVRVAIVDNDPRGSAEATVRAARRRLPWDVDYEVEPEPGIPAVRNRLVRLAAGCRYLVFVDDDQTVAPGWLDEHLSVAADTGAGAVLGPSPFQFEAEPPDWFELIQRPEFRDREAISYRLFRTGNLMLRRSVLEAFEVVFNPKYAFSGGSDTELGLRLEAAGVALVWAAKARAVEHLPASRMTLKWVLLRRYRVGANAVRFALEREAYPSVLTRHLRSVRHAVRVHAPMAVRALAAGDLKAVFVEAQVLSNQLGVLGGLAGISYDEYRHQHIAPDPDIPYNSAAKFERSR